MEKIETYDEKSAIVSTLILSSLEASQAQQVLNLDDAGDIWKKLKNIHEEKVTSRRVDLRVELSSIKKNEKETFDQYLARGQFIRDQLAQCGANIETEEYIGLMVEWTSKNLQFDFK